MGYADLFTGMSEKQMENFNKLYEKVMGEMIDTSINRIKEWMNKKTENNEEYPIFALNDVVYILPDDDAGRYSKLERKVQLQRLKKVKS
jgi:hypothetical protein